LPATAPLIVSERNALSEALWNEPEITWLRVLGSAFNPISDKNYREVSMMRHFNAFPQDIGRMSAYWMRSRHPQELRPPLLQSYLAAKVMYTDESRDMKSASVAYSLHRSR